MCEFISWIKFNNKILFLSDTEFNDCKRHWGDFNKSKSERYGHGAIRWYYGIKEVDGMNEENTDLLEPSNFPKEIQDSIKQGKITYCIDILKILSPIGIKRLSKKFQKAYADKQKVDTNKQKVNADRQKEYAVWQKEYADWQKANAIWQKAYADRQKVYAVLRKAYADSKTKISSIIHKPINRIKAWR